MSIHSEKTFAFPSPPTDPAQLLIGRVFNDLCQGGTLASQLPGYEERPAQLTMATLVAEALAKGIPALIEAGTGVGKSLGYLIPVIRSGKTALVSTANKTLQDQLFLKDIPFLQRHLSPFQASLVKGVANYVCLDRMHNARKDLHIYEHEAFQHLMRALEQPECIGDLETLGVTLSADLRSRINGDSDQCAWKKCPSFEPCYIRKMRETARQAQVIVINHTLLLLDAALDNALLPERDVIILDEAHHLEDEATTAFTLTVKPTQIISLLALNAVRNHTPSSLQEEVKMLSTVLWQRVEQLPFGHANKVLLVSSLQEAQPLSLKIEDLGKALREQRPPNQDEKEEALYDKLITRTENLARNIRQVFTVEQPSAHVHYAERTPGERGFSFQVCSAPLTVAPWLKEKLFDRCNVIMASATLATGSSQKALADGQPPSKFAYFRSRVGLDQVEVKECILPLAFDYQQNALLYIPRHLPEPIYGTSKEAQQYVQAIAQEMRELVSASHGRAFLLFSSRRMLEEVYALIAPQLPYPLFRQGEMSRTELTRRFKAEQGSVLFGLKTFWEGVDIAGDALSLVVIDKLPFSVPDDPVHQARVSQMKAKGENWFGDYVLPQVVLQLKQGVGRLLRTREDRGVMAILDSRLTSRGYGRQVIAALPPATRTSQIADVQHFFANCV